ncbi:MAG: IS3 family transposase [Bacteroidota bacterium]
MTISTMTALAGVSRASFYRFDPEAKPAVRDIELRHAIQLIALRFPTYGRPRITAQLRDQGIQANHKVVGRILREDNLLCIRKRKFKITTDSNHSFPVFPNLARGFIPASANQLWVADITYIRLDEEFVYLAVVLDAFSRLVIGWALERTLESDLALGALRMALAKRGAPDGLIHHSDRGVQYACHDYTRLLKEHGIRGSMSRKGNPYDNAKAESFMKTLKYEEVYRTEYRDIAHARKCIREFLERTYNKRRLHSALGYKSPAAFESAATARKVPA